ncbi:phosphotransferase 1 [Pseudoneurospora amorphoporcata]|uniref:2'-phosphotransferase n=1 Tax=Pseudoneurospora amorphoporcata TaxID=241081 RepID=A0AAN6SJ62_9PEZI|nr:phosphotransferase 1 [Pseudoneurospora amorphoporcata]
MRSISSGNLLTVVPTLRISRLLIVGQARAFIHSTTTTTTTSARTKSYHRYHHYYHKMASAEDRQDVADRAPDSSSRVGRGPKSGRGGGRGGHDGHRKGGRDVDLSRALSKLLRHQASSAGITLDAEGYAPLDKVLAWGPIKSLKPTFEEILKAVRESDKQRFAIKLAPGKENETSEEVSDWLIRANQGHSIKLESEGLLRRLVLPGQEGMEEGKEGEEGAGTVPVPHTVIHGTYFAFWDKIVESGGLKAMGRNHVHFSTGLPEDTETGVISGMRKDAEVLVFVDVECSIKEENEKEGGGMKWWMSDNGVVLTEGDKDGLVPLKYFKEVRGRRQGVGLLWKDGQKVADLPEGLEVKMPMGKGRAGGGGGGKGGRGGRGVGGGGRGGHGKGGRGREEKESMGEEAKPQEVDSQ